MKENTDKGTRNYYEETIQTVDRETGETEIVERRTKKTVSRDKFIMLFLTDIQGIIGLTSKAEFKVLIAISEMVSYNTNEIILVKPVKERIAKKTEMNYFSVKNTISKLYKKEILIRKGSSTYVLNPKYFFKGEDAARSKVLRWTVEYIIEDEPKE